MRTYKARRIGRLLFTTAAIKGPQRPVSFTLLIDTGSSYTLLPWAHLNRAGYNPSFQEGHTQIVTASGVVMAPKVKVEWFSCCGLKLDSFSIVAHTLPWNLAKFGILGMDFLQRARAHIDIANAEVFVALE